MGARGTGDRISSNLQLSTMPLLVVFRTRRFFARTLVALASFALPSVGLRAQAPAITASPVARQTILRNHNLSLNATVTGATTYQWKRNGFTIPGATNAIYTLSGAQPWRDAGWYQLVASNGSGSSRTTPCFVGVVVTPAEVKVWGQTVYGAIPAPGNLTSVIGVAAGGEHAMALRSDGTVSVWGFSNSNQTAIPSGLDNVVKVAAGAWQCLALKADGTVVAWGGNYSGEGSVPSGLSDVVDIASAGAFNVAVKSDGTVVAWGKNTAGVGEATVPSGLSNVVAVATGQQHTIALKADGTVTGWGDNFYGQATPPGGLGNVIAVAVGALHSLALKADGTVVAWGSNTDGQATVPSGLANVIAIAAGQQHSAALKADGTVVVWGVDTNGVRTGATTLTRGVSLASGLSYFGVLLRDTADEVAPVIVTAMAPRTVVNRGQSLVLTAMVSGATSYQWKRNGLSISGATQSGYVVPSAQPWRDAGWYQLVASNAVGATKSAVMFLNVATTPAQVAGFGANFGGVLSPAAGLSAVTGLSAGYDTAVAAKADGTVVSWGFDHLGGMVPPSGLADVVAISSGFNHALALRSDGSLVGWGDPRPMPPSGTSGCVAISAGPYHTLALKADGTVLAWDTEDYYGRSAVPSGLQNVVSVAAGFYHSLALKADGTVVGWGANWYGEIEPPAGLSGVIAITAGYGFSGALKGDGTVVLWGNPSSSITTIPAGLNNVVAITGGNGHMVALRNDGTLVAWGENYYGQTRVPSGLAGVTGVSMSAGSYFTMLMRDATGDSSGPVIVTQPPSAVTAVVGGNLTLPVTLASNPAVPAYQWRKNGSPVSQANGPVFSNGYVQVSDVGTYDVVVSNAFGTTISSATTVSITLPPPPTITTQPKRGVLNVGDAGSFSVSANGTGYFTYQWRKNGNAISSPSAATSQLFLGPVQLSDAGTYDVVVTNPGGPTTSDAVTLEVYPLAPAQFTLQPTGAILNAGDVASFQVAVTGAAPLTLQWRKDGVAIPNSNGVRLLLGPATVSIAGTYDVVASNGFGNVTSAPATLWLSEQLVAPAFSAAPANRTVSAGASAVFTAVATGTPAPTFQWRHAGVPIAGATSSVLTLANVQETDAGTYDVVATNIKASTTSGAATLTVRGQPVLWSARLALTNGEALGVFTVEGTAPKKLLVRAVGPTLATFLVSDPLADPKLEIFDATGSLLASNGNWSTITDQAGLASATSAAGAFALSSNSKDAVVLRSFAAGTYFARVTPAVAGGRMVLLELYDAEPTSATRVPYTAVRARVGNGDEILVGGVGVSGTSQRTYLLRAAGPALGAAGTLANPTFTVLRDNVVRASNDDWQSGTDTLGVATAAARVGAFAFGDGSRDAGMLLSANLHFGTYTGQILGAGGTGGLALVEVVEADDTRPATYPPVVVSPPITQAAPLGTNLTLEGRALGTEPITYQWRKDGTNIVGANTRTLTLTNVVPANAGNYTLVANNAFGTSTSLSAAITIDGTSALATATHALANGVIGYAAGSTLTITNTLSYSGAATSLAWSTTLPAGWTYAGTSGSGGIFAPTAGSTGTIAWTWETPPPSPVTFAYTVNVPAGDTGVKGLNAGAVVRAAGGAYTVTTTPNPLLVPPSAVFHSADTNQDMQIGLIELTRVIELYNTRNGTTRTGAYQVATTITEDGFTPEPVRTAASNNLTRYHSADTHTDTIGSARDGRLNLTELTRVIELYNTRVGTVRTGAYHLASGTEDGFAPGP